MSAEQATATRASKFTLVEQLRQACGRLSRKGCNSSCARGPRPEAGIFFASTSTRIEGSILRVVRRQLHLPRTDPLGDGADNIGPRCCSSCPTGGGGCRLEHEPFASNGGYQRDARIMRWVFGD